MKKILALLVTLTLLAGCGSKAEQSASSSGGLESVSAVDSSPTSASEDADILSKREAFRSSYAARAAAILHRRIYFRL